MAITQAESFASVLEKSDLLDPEQLAVAKSLLAGIKDSKSAAKKLIEKGLLTRWQASQLLAGKTDLHLGKYRLLDRLGQGGMGSVFLAEHKTMRRRVAIKTLPPDATEKGAAVQRLREEARAISSLDHRNIIHAYDTELAGDRPYLVLEYIVGQDLEKIVLATGRLDFRRAADYIAQAAEGLAHAHSRHLLHRDIKPANLLVDAQGTVKILDLGLASIKHPESETHGAAAENVLGTVDFLPPEQALGGDSLDQRSDIYSLGCTLYFVLTGQPPFPDGSLAEKLVKHQIEEPRSLLKLRPKTPHELVKICRKMMAKKPEERFATADEVASGLRKWLAEAGGEVPDDSSDGPLTSSGAMPALGKNGAAGAPPAKVRPPVLAPRAISDSGPLAELGLDFDYGSGNGKSKQVGPPPTRPANEADADAAPRMSRQTKMILFSSLGIGALAVVGIVVAILIGGDKTDKDKLSKDAVNQTDPVKKSDSVVAKNPSGLPSPKSDDPSGKLPPVGPKGSSTNSTSDKPLPDKFQDVPQKTVDNPKPEDKPKAEETPKPDDKPKKPKDKPKLPDKPKDPPPEDRPPEVKPAEPQPGDPFKELATLTELPMPTGETPGDPVALGKVALPKDGKLAISLATPSGKSAPKFLVQAGADPALQNEWTVQVEGAADAEPVAKIFLRGNEFSFQWTAAAKTPADQIRNGLLTLKSGDKERVIAFRKCVDAPQIAVDLDHPRNAPKMGVNIDLESLPDVENLWLEVLKPEANDLTFEIQKGEPLSLKTPVKFKDAPLVAFGTQENKKLPKAMGFAMTCALHGRLGVRVEALPEVQFNNQWMPLQPVAMTNRLNQLLAQQADMPNQLKAMQTAKQPNAAAIEAFKKDTMPAVDREVKAMQDLEKLVVAVKAKAKLNYRLFTKVGDRELELVRSVAQ